MADEIVINSAKLCLEHIQHLQSEFKEHGYLVVTVKSGKIRTDKQNRSIHLFCTMLATAFNMAGLDQRKVLAKMREGVEIPWSPPAIKENIWRQIQIAILNKHSTTKLERVEVSRVYDVVNRWTSNTFGLSVEFPEDKSND